MTATGRKQIEFLQGFNGNVTLGFSAFFYILYTSSFLIVQWITTYLMYLSEGNYTVRKSNLSYCSLLWRERWFYAAMPLNGLPFLCVNGWVCVCAPHCCMAHLHSQGPWHGQHRLMNLFKATPPRDLPIDKSICPLLLRFPLVSSLGLVFPVLVHHVHGIVRSAKGPAQIRSPFITKSSIKKS